MLIIAAVSTLLHLPFLGEIKVALAGGTVEARDVPECFSVVVVALERDRSLASLRKVL